jgi:signal peptidase I
MTEPQTLEPARRSRPRRRRAWLAALLSFFAPGTGQLYNGEARSAVVLFAFFAVFDLAFFFVLRKFDPDLPVLGIFVLLTVLGLALQIGAAIHAFIHGRRSALVSLRTYQRGWIYAAMIIALPALNFAAGPWLVKSYYVPSGSNIPTLLVGDRFLAETDYYRDHALQRGDMIVFLSPKDGRTVFVKRIVGLPGEKIQMRHGNLYINDQMVPRRQIDDYPHQSEDSSVAMHQYIETLPSGASEAGISHRILKVGDDGPLDDTPVYDVPAGHYFALGDNRDNSLDSRVLSTFGYVPAASLIGRAYIIYWPLARLGYKFD